MILYWYIHWFWITLLRSGLAAAYSTQPAPGANDSLVPAVLRPAAKSLSPNVVNRNLVHPNRTVTTIAASGTLNATDTKLRSISSVSATVRTTPTAPSTVMDELDGFNKNDIFIQPRINVSEVDKPTLVDSLRPRNDSSNIIAMGYTNNSFEDNINNTIAHMNDTEMLETAHPQVPFNISHSSVANSNLIDNSGGNIGPTEGQLTAAGITGITVGCVGVVGLLSAVSFLLYRYRTLNRPEALNDYCSNLDSSGYIDDTSIRDNSEEMYSLDNDSFLNSLEAMTIQNYWTDKVKHTKL